MARRTCRNCRDRSQTQALAQAAAIIAQGRQVEAGLRKEQARSQVSNALEDEEPMNRYIHPIPLSIPRARGDRPENCIQVQESLERVLECMACQNQLLVDILGAINALTAAMLSAQSHP